MDAEELIEKARKEILYFIVYMDPKYQIANHHRKICQEIMRVIKIPDSRSLISVPPRHGKSTIISEYLPAFVFGLASLENKQENIITASYSAPLATSFGKKVRRIMSSEKYKKLFPGVKILGDSNAGSHIEVEGGGEYKAVGRGGSITGFSSTLTIIDDIIKDSKEANSERIRTSLREWFDSTMYSRTLPGGKIIVVSTRWHQDDLQGYLMTNGQWDHINIPAICEEGEDDLGRKRGEALWPNWYSIDYLNDIRTRNPYQFSALYQGNPVAIEGNLLEEKWIKRDNTHERFDYIVASFDTASTTSESSSYTAGLVFGVKSNIAYVLDIYHDKIKFPGLIEKIDEFTKNKYFDDPIDYFLVEDASSGTQILQLAEANWPNKKFIKISKQQNKVQKFFNNLDLVEEGRVIFPNRKTELEEELLAFPYSKFTDLTVAFIHFLEWWRKETHFFTRKLPKQGIKKEIQGNLKINDNFRLRSSSKNGRRQIARIG